MFMYLLPNHIYYFIETDFNSLYFRLTIVVTLRGAVCALITQVVSTASEQFRPGRRNKRTFESGSGSIFCLSDMISFSYVKSYAWFRAAVLL